MTATILTSIGIREPSYDDCYIIREVCKTVSLRAAKLAAAGNKPIVRLVKSNEIFFSNRCSDQSFEYAFSDSGG